MRPIRALVLAALLAALPCGAAHAASMFDPKLPWKTIVTPHFRVNFPAGDEAIAELAAGYAEDANKILSPYLASEPKQRTELTLFDNEDTTNGFGFPLPNNQIVIYLASPNEDELFNRYDSWLRDLILHEYTHVLHFEKSKGLPAWVDRVLGRSYFPNMFLPVFMTEGLAVTDETQFDTGGRGRGAAYRTVLRLTALAHKLPSIDQASGYYVTDFPGGDTPYMYGWAFYRYLIAHYGADAPRKLADATAHQPYFGFWGVDQSLEQVTGENFAHFWKDLQADLTARAERQKKAILAQGPLTPLHWVTQGGQFHRHPLFDPKGRLEWAQWTGNSYSHLMRRNADGKVEKLGSLSPFGTYSLSRDGRYRYESLNGDEDRFTSYTDIFRVDTKKKRLERLTDRKRLSDPAVSPDGYWVVAVQSGHGQSNLVKMRADGSGLRNLTQLTDRSQFSAPIWHPTRDLLAVSVWRDGCRDLYLVNPEDGRMAPIWRDRDVELDPTWSPDGRYLVFSSDRTGVYNLYAYDLVARKLYRMTNVLGGLIEPAVSPDMKTVAAAGYDLKGFDIVTLPWNPASWTPMPLPESHPNIHQPLPNSRTDYPTIAYNPWPSLQPKVWAPFAFWDGQGPVVGATTLGEDSLIKHFLYGAAGWGLVSHQPFYTIAYDNEQLYPSLYAYAADQTYLNSADTQGITFYLQQRALSQGISATFPGLPSAFLQNNWVTGDTFSIGLNFQNVQTLTPLPSLLPANKAPETGQTNTVAFTYQYGDNYKFAYSISPEGGNLVTLGYEQAVPLLGSQYSFGRTWADWRHYFALPWPHQVLAVRAQGGATIGSHGGKFYLGGFQSATYLPNVDLRTASTVGTSLIDLRGYGLGAQSGAKAFALSTEYRFPLATIDRGYSIYPVFVTTLSGALFAETGQAWDGAFDPRKGLASVGAELVIAGDVAQAPGQVRLGIGQGLVNTGTSAPWPALYMDLGSYF